MGLDARDRTVVAERSRGRQGRESAGVGHPATTNQPPAAPIPQAAKQAIEKLLAETRAAQQRNERLTQANAALAEKVKLASQQQQESASLRQRLEVAETRLAEALGEKQTLQSANQRLTDQLREQPKSPQPNLESLRGEVQAELRAALEAKAAAESALNSAQETQREIRDQLEHARQIIRDQEQDLAELHATGGQAAQELREKTTTVQQQLASQRKQLAELQQAEQAARAEVEAAQREATTSKTALQSVQGQNADLKRRLAHAQEALDDARHAARAEADNARRDGAAVDAALQSARQTSRALEHRLTLARRTLEIQRERTAVLGAADIAHRAEAASIRQALEESRRQCELLEAARVEGEQEAGAIAAEVETARRRIDALSNETATLRASLADAQRACQSESEQREALNREFDQQSVEHENQLNQALRIRSQLEARLDAALCRIHWLQGEQDRLTSQVASLHEERDAALAVGVQADEQIAILRRDVARRQDAVETLKRQLEEAHDRRRQDGTEMEQLRRAQLEASQARGALEDEVRQLRARRDAAQHEVESLQAEVRDQQAARESERDRAVQIASRRRARLRQRRVVRAASEVERNRKFAERTQAQSDAAAVLEEQLATAREALRQSELRWSERESEQRALESKAAEASEQLKHVKSQLTEASRRLAAERDHARTAAEERDAVLSRINALEHRWSEMQSGAESAARLANDLKHEAQELRTARDYWQARLQKVAAENRKLSAALRQAAASTPEAGRQWREHENEQLQLRVKRLTAALGAAHRRNLDLREKARLLITSLRAQAATGTASSDIHPNRAG